MALNNFDKRTMKLGQVTHLQGDNRIQNAGLCNAHKCDLCLFVGHYLSLQAYETPLI